MRLPEFRYVFPRQIGKAVSSQEKSGKFLAGGTDLFVSMKERISCPELLIDLNGISELKRIGWDKKKRIRIGALVRLAQLKENALVLKHIPILSQTITLVSTPQLQNMGTVGGNLCLDTRCYYYNQSAFLKKRWTPCFKMGGKTCHVVKGGDSCHAVYSGDLASLLIALGASVKVIGEGSAREIALQNFFSGSGIKPNILKFNEIVSEILIPLRRNIQEFPTRSSGSGIQWISRFWGWPSSCSSKERTGNAGTLALFWGLLRLRPWSSKKRLNGCVTRRLPRNL